MPAEFLQCSQKRIKNKRKKNKIKKAVVLLWLTDSKIILNFLFLLCFMVFKGRGKSMLISYITIHTTQLAKYSDNYESTLLRNKGKGKHTHTAGCSMAQRKCEATQEECLCTIYNVRVVFNHSTRMTSWSEGFTSRTHQGTVMLSGFKDGSVSLVRTIKSLSHILSSVFLEQYEALFFSGTKLQ